MFTVLKFVVVLLALLLQFSVILSDRGSKNDGDMGEDDLAVELVESSGGILSVETRTTTDLLFARQMTNGRDLLKLIYVEGGRLAACERFQGQTVELELFLNRYSSRQRQPEFKVNRTESWERSWKECVRLQEEKEEELISRAYDPVNVKVKSSRSRRTTLIVPGTTWCGVGNAAVNQNETEGVHIETDRCCRQHDHCEHTIEGFTRKYGLFNFRFHTISHCLCDDIFRRCLKMAGDEKSNLVGRLFFDVLGMKCFTLHQERVCVERTWWGKCTQNGFEPRATLRDPSDY